MKKTLLASAVLLALASTASAAGLSFNSSNAGSETSKTVTGSELVYDEITTNGASLVVNDGLTLNVGDENTQSVTVTATGDTNTGIFARLNDSSMTVKAKDIVVTASGLESEGVRAASNDINGVYAKLKLEADNINITATGTDSVGVVAMSEGDVELVGNVTISADHAILTRGNSKVSMGQSGETVKLTGDITFDWDQGGGGTNAVNSEVNVKLNGPESFWKGNAKVAWDVEEASKLPNTDDLTVTSLNLVLANGATWTPVAIAKNSTVGTTSAELDADSRIAINKVVFEGEGNTVVIESGVEADVGEMTGEGTVHMDSANPGKLSVSDGDGAVLEVTMTGDADTVTEEKAAAVMANVTGVANATGTVEEGMYNGAMTLNADGEVTAVATNSVMSNTLDLASSAPLAMNRLLMNDVRKRMGDLRASEGAHGVWARYDGGKLSGSNSLENDFTTIQVGIDTVPVVDAPRFGVAFSYTTSDADMKRGGAEMDAFGLAFYGTKMYDNGMFVDVIGRMATVDADMKVSGNKGKMDNVALSLSGELGWRFDVTDRFFIEPSAELTYTYTNADTFTMGTAKYELEATDSLIGRAGFVAGFKCPANKGDVYVRAAVVHEFMGDVTMNSWGANGNAATPIETDGEDTYFEYAVGAQFNINKNTYVYADVERTEGANVDEDWRANVGVRFAF